MYTPAPPSYRPYAAFFHPHEQISIIVTDICEFFNGFLHQSGTFSQKRAKTAIKSRQNIEITAFLCYNKK